MKKRKKRFQPTNNRSLLIDPISHGRLTVGLIAFSQRFGSLSAFIGDKLNMCGTLL